MKNNKKKFIICILPVLLLLGAVGFKATRVELINADKPLVDLEAILSEGGSYMPDDALLEELGEAIETDVTSEDNSSSYVNIRVRDKNIYVNGSFTSENTFEDIFDNYYKDGMKVKLEDDYARYPTFKFLLDHFRKNSIPYSITVK
ncbi:MAG: hypothetical protein K6A74_07250 [Lachnospiraceae bacterium]|nr:hypothetical protein [Lachnospiraceae bacterium]